jgi:Pyruvate/2-oxoacid:ferredoxin oxidoreductase delta subunit
MTLSDRDCDRARSHVKGGEGLFEEFQISAIFGHESGAMAGTQASRLGYLELADGGTIVLKNVDRLSPGTRERLVFYLLEKKFYRLGAIAGITVDTRVIAATNVGDSITDEEMRESLRGKIPEVFWKNKVDLPSLALRRRDIPMIAEAFLEKHAALAGKSIKTICAPAMNTLIRYTWPGNDRELENVIERGVLVCEGDTLLAEHIFLGLTPYSEKGRLNLLRLGSFRKVFANLKLRAIIQAAVVVVMMGVVCLTLLGAKESDKNLGMGMVWYYWWPFLLLSFLFLGRFYCSVCPIDGLTKLFRKMGSLNRPAPRIFNRIGVGLAAVLGLALSWGEYLFQVKEITIRTSIFLGIILSSAIIVNFIFRPEVWCRYVCPWGYFSGVCACLAFVELRANNKVCSSQCKSTLCYKSNGQQAGCPMKRFPVSLMSNQFCKMCGTCVHNCPYNSVHLDLRWPGSEIWKNMEPNPVTSLSIGAGGQ